MYNEKLITALIQFFHHFESVFHYDWEMTKSRICNRLYISETGTFINPEVEDEENNWANRAGLLESYRTAKALIDPIDTSTCIFRFVRLNHKSKSVEEMAHEIMEYGWCSNYHTAISSIKENLLFDDDKQDEPPSLFDNM